MRDTKLTFLCIQKGCCLPFLPHSFSRLTISFSCNFVPWYWASNRNVVLNTGTSFSFCQPYQESPKVVLSNQHNLDSLSLNTFYTVEGKVNPNPFLMTKPLVPYEEVFWSCSWPDILIASGISGIFAKFLQRNKNKKLRNLRLHWQGVSLVLYRRWNYQVKLQLDFIIQVHQQE